MILIAFYLTNLVRWVGEMKKLRFYRDVYHVPTDKQTLLVKIFHLVIFMTRLPASQIIIKGRQPLFYLQKFPVSVLK